MNFDFSEQQKLIQTEARRFLREQCTNDMARCVMDDESASFDQTLWRKVVDLGWLAMSIPERFGGSGLGSLEQCVLAQELGRSLAPIPFSSTVYFLAEALQLVGSEAQMQKWLPKIAAGELVGALAVSEASGNSLESTPSCLVEAKDNGLVLSGRKTAVVDGLVADLAIVSANDKEGTTSLFLVELDQTRVDRQTLNGLDPSRPISEIRFDQASAELLGDVGEGVAILRALYDRSAVLFAFEQIGGCEAALKMGIDYTKQRYAFGRQVASFQAIKHKFADMFVAKEIALANAYYAAWALNTDAPELSVAAATARVSAINAYFECSKENLQAHGGMGYTWEFDCHLHYRRAQSLSLNLGSTHYWKERLVTELLDLDTNSEA